MNLSKKVLIILNINLNVQKNKFFIIKKRKYWSESNL